MINTAALGLYSALDDEKKKKKDPRRMLRLVEQHHNASIYICAQELNGRCYLTKDVFHWRDYCLLTAHTLTAAFIECGRCTSATLKYKN